MEKINNRDLVSFLKSRSTEKYGIIDTLKISYRPYICPFDDLLSVLPKCECVFDIGCGSGVFLSLVAQFKEPRIVGGIEISPHLIENAKAILSKNPQVASSFNVYNGKKIPSSIIKYNYIFLIDVLHHIPLNLRDEFLRDIYTSMKEGATLVIKDINAKSILSYWNKIHDLLFAGEIGNEPHPDRLDETLKTIGYKTSIISYKRMLLYPHFTIYCTK